jgi:glycine/D-amino acid oxidase-like deaminating enzyme
VPGYEGLYVAVGFSGHGFKMAPTVGESLAQTVLGQTPRVPIEMYDMARFAEGKQLHGAYGIGSIS